MKVPKVRSQRTPVRLPSALGNLVALIGPLSLDPSLQPSNSLALGRSVAQAFSPRSDLAPKLIGALKPTVADVIYKAWANTEVPGSQVEVDAFRVKTGLFPGVYPGLPTSTHPLNSDGKTYDEESVITIFKNPPLINPDWQDMYVPDANSPSAPATIALDAAYDKVVAGSWIIIDRPDWTYPDGKNTATLVGRKQTVHKVIKATAAAMKTYDAGFSAKVTQLTTRSSMAQ